MKEIVFNKSIEVETNDDMTVSIQGCRTEIIDTHGKHPRRADIAFLIEDVESRKEMVTFLSTENMDQLINKLKDLNKEVKAYNQRFA